LKNSHQELEVVGSNPIHFFIQRSLSLVFSAKLYVHLIVFDEKLYHFHLKGMLLKRNWIAAHVPKIF